MPLRRPPIVDVEVVPDQSHLFKMGHVACHDWQTVPQRDRGNNIRHADDTPDSFEVCDDTAGEARSSVVERQDLGCVSEASNCATRSSRPTRRKPYTISATVVAEVVTQPCCARYLPALAVTTALLPLRISDRISVSSRTLLIDCAQVGRAPRFVRERAHLVDEVWFVSHQTEQRRSGAQRAFRDRAIHVLHAYRPDSGSGRQPRTKQVIDSRLARWGDRGGPGRILCHFVRGAFEQTQAILQRKPPNRGQDFVDGTHQHSIAPFRGLLFT